MPTRTHNQDGHPAHSTINTHFNYLRDLPHPDNEYTAYQAPKGVRHRRRKFIDAGIIHVVDETPDKHRSHVYRTDPRVYEIIQDKKKSLDLLPCGHRGITNERGGGFSCGYEFCDVQYTREEVEGLDL